MTAVTATAAEEMLNWANRRSDWIGRAACANLDALPWVSDSPEDIAVCIPICRACPVRDHCLAEAMSYGLHDYAQVGVIGATTTPQRVWLAANRPAALEVAEECAAAGVDTDELSDWYEAVGPETMPAEAAARTDREIAAEWGVARPTWRRWAAERGMNASKGTASRERAKQHADAHDLVERILRTSAAAGRPWVQRGLLRDAMIRDLPVSMVADAEQMQTRGHRKAWDNVLASVIQCGQRSDRIEMRPDPDDPQRRLVRWAAA